MPALDLTWYQLEALNVVRCECGHRTNNHFDHYRGRWTHPEASPGQSTPEPEKLR